MFLEQIDKNRKEAFEYLVERKGQDKNTVFVDDEGYYCYRTKRGLLKTFAVFDSFIKYKKSDFYPEKPEQVNGFYFVPLIRNGGKYMKKYNLRINFFWDDGDDMWEFRIEVPENVTIEEIKETLLKTHKYLAMEDETDLYGTTGRNPVTLLDYICKKYGWGWEGFSFDIDMNFN